MRFLDYLHRKNHFRLAFPGFLISWLLTGCYIYHPMPTDIPLISHKKDLRIDAGVSLLPSVHSTVSYGLTDKIAVQGFGTYIGEGKNYFQAAAGFYKNTVNKEILEIYGGYGQGIGTYTVGGSPDDIWGNYRLYFTQFNYGSISGKSHNFEAGIGLKLGYLNSRIKEEISHYNPEENSTEIEMKTHHYNGILTEPMAVLRMGGEKVRFSLKVGATRIFRLKQENIRFEYMKGNLGLGINFRL